MSPALAERKSVTAPAGSGTTVVPGPSCQLQGAPAVTLDDTSPTVAITVAVGSTLVVWVPPWSWGRATVVDIVEPSVLSESCSVLLPDGGRRALLLARNPGRSLLAATVYPASEAAMPAWSALVTVVSSTPSPSPAAPAAPTPGVLSTSIELPSTTLVSGSTVSGALVVTNHSDATVNLTRMCKLFWQVGVQSATAPFDPVEPTLCSTAPFLLRSGVNRLPFTMKVTYENCSTTGELSPSVPPCGADGAPPPLSPGPYQVVLVSQTPVLAAQPVSVNVVAAPSS